MNKLNWEEYFLSIVQTVALRSKDPNTKVGAVIVNKNNRIIATGYNGMPRGDDTFPWSVDSKDISKNKYAYVIHAELNAILNAVAPIEDSTIYTTLFPCSDCAKLIAQSKIKKIIYANDKYNNTIDNKISKFILDKVEVKYKKGLNIFVEIKKYNPE